jgi:hypothetical protein
MISGLDNILSRHRIRLESCESNATEHDEYQKSFARVLRDLTVKKP